MNTGGWGEEGEGGVHNTGALYPRGHVWMLLMPLDKLLSHEQTVLSSLTLTEHGLSPLLLKAGSHFCMY